MTLLTPKREIIRPTRRKFIAGIGLALAAPYVARAGSMTLLGAGKAPGNAYDPATVAWVNAVVTAGGTVSSTQEGYVDTLIKGLKSDGNWSSGSRLWLHASENAQQATIDIINLGVATAHGTLTFTANQGYAGDGSSGYLDSGFSHDTNYVSGSGTLLSYVRGGRTSGSSSVVLGAFCDSSETEIQPLDTAPKFVFEVQGATYPYNAGQTNANGLYICTRTDSSNTACYKNGSGTAFSSSASDTLRSITNWQNFAILAYNILGTITDFSTDQVAASGIWSAVTSTQAVAISSRVNTYMTSVGANVY